MSAAPTAEDLQALARRALEDADPRHPRARDLWRLAVDAAAPVEGLGAETSRLADDVVSELEAGPTPERSDGADDPGLALLLASLARPDEGGELRARIERLVRDRYLGRALPASAPPGPGSLVTPALVTLHLAGRVIASGSFLPWLDDELPGLAEVAPVALRSPPPEPPAGAPRPPPALAWSRAWNWRGIARVLPPRDDRRTAALDAADRHIARALEDEPGTAADAAFALLVLAGV